jgi:hypothetical protein
MKKLIWVAAGIVVLAGAAAALTLVKPSKLLAAPPNEEMAPDTLVAFAQVDGLAPVWAQVQGTEAWKDLLASPAAKEFGDAPTGKALSDLSREAETKAAYALDAKHAMQFFGRQVSVGLDRVPADGEPGWLLLTKLDVDALVAEMLEGKRDWRGLHEEFERRAGQVGFQVSQSEHKDRRVSTAKRDGVEVHATLLGDTLAVSSSLDLLRRTIDVTEASGAGSLAKSPRFRDETARLPQGRLGWHWFDLQALRESKASLVAWLHRMQKGGDAAAAAGRILEGTAAAPALAVATELPGGDLYQVRWSYSRTAAELSGGGAPKDLLGAVGEFPFSMAVHDVGSIAGAWDKSALRRRISEGAIGQEFRKHVEDTTEVREFLQEIADKQRSYAASVENDEEMGDEEDEEEDEQGGAPRRKPRIEVAASSLVPDKFSLKMGLHLFRETLSHGLTGDAALAGDWHGGDTGLGEPGVIAAAGLGTEGYLGSLALEGLALAEGKIRRADRKGVPMFVQAEGSEDGKKVCVAHLGETLLLSNDADMLGRALDAAARGAAAPAGAAKFDPGWCVRGRADTRRLGDTMSGLMGPDESKAFLATMPDTVEFATYVAPDLSWVEMRAVSSYAQDIVQANASGEPRTWKWLPERTILVAGCAIEPREILAVVRKTLPDAEEFDQGLAEIKRELEVDIEGELLPALGPEIALAVVRKSADGAAGGPAGGAPPIPGVVLSFEVKDETNVRRTVDAAVRAIERQFAEQQAQRGGEPPARIVRENADGLQLVRFEPTEPEEIPIVPTLAFGRGRLLLGLDMPVVDACLDAGAERSPSLAASPVRQRMRARAEDMGGAWMLLDWGGALDQVAEYAPMIAEAFPAKRTPDGRKRPEFPMDGNEQDYERFEKEMAAFTEATRGSQVAEVKKWIDAFRLIDHIAIVGSNKGRVEERRLIVKFAD